MKIGLIVLLFLINNSLLAEQMTEISAVIGESPVKLIEGKNQTTVLTRMPQEILKIDRCSAIHLKSFWSSLHNHLKRKNSIDINGLPEQVYKYVLNGKEYSASNKTVWGNYLSKLPMKADLLVNTVRRVCKK